MADGRLLYLLGIWSDLDERIRKEIVQAASRAVKGRGATEGETRAAIERLAGFLRGTDDGGQR